MQRAVRKDTPPSKQADHHSLKSKASRYFIRTPSFASFRSSPNTVDSENTRDRQKDPRTNGSRLQRVRLSVSSLAARLPLFKRMHSMSFPHFLCSLTSQGTAQNHTWTLLHFATPKLPQQYAQSVTPESLPSNSDGLVQEVNSTPLETAPTMNSCHHGRYLRLRLLRSHNASGLFALQTQAQVPSTDRRAIKNSHPTIAQVMEGAGSHIASRNASKTSMAG